MFRSEYYKPVYNNSKDVNGTEILWESTKGQRNVSTNQIGGGESGEGTRGMYDGSQSKVMSRNFGLPGRTLESMQKVKDTEIQIQNIDGQSKRVQTNDGTKRGRKTCETEDHKHVRKTLAHTDADSTIDCDTDSDVSSSRLTHKDVTGIATKEDSANEPPRDISDRELEVEVLESSQTKSNGTGNERRELQSLASVYTASFPRETTVLKTATQREDSSSLEDMKVFEDESPKKEMVQIKREVIEMAIESTTKIPVNYADEESILTEGDMDIKSIGSSDSITGGIICQNTTTMDDSSMGHY